MDIATDLVKEQYAGKSFYHFASRYYGMDNLWTFISLYLIHEFDVTEQSERLTEDLTV